MLYTHNITTFADFVKGNYEAFSVVNAYIFGRVALWNYSNDAVSTIQRLEEFAITVRDDVVGYLEGRRTLSNVHDLTTFIAHDCERMFGKASPMRTETDRVRDLTLPEFERELFAHIDEGETVFAMRLIRMRYSTSLYGAKAMMEVIRDGGTPMTVNDDHRKIAETHLNSRIKSMQSRINALESQGDPDEHLTEADAPFQVPVDEVSPFCNVPVESLGEMLKVKLDGGQF